jgi:hypothetical protein
LLRDKTEARPMVRKEKLKSEIEEVVREHIHSGNVLNVVVERGTDSDGENVIFVHVVFDNKSNRIDAKETVGITRHVRARLSKLGEDGFPLFYYVAKSEAGKLAEAR